MSTQQDKLTAIADAIREKDGTTAPIPANDFPSRIRAIKQGVELPDLTVPGSAGDVLSGKQLIDANGKVLTGTMPTATQATPSINVSSSGLITASANQRAGYVPEGTKSTTQQLATKAAAVITPGTAAQTAVPAGRYTTGAITVAGDVNLIASNIKSGVSIFGVTGSYIKNFDVSVYVEAVADNTVAHSISLSLPRIYARNVIGYGIFDNTSYPIDQPYYYKIILSACELILPSYDNNLGIKHTGNIMYRSSNGDITSESIEDNNNVFSYCTVPIYSSTVSLDFDNESFLINRKNMYVFLLLKN